MSAEQAGVSPASTIGMALSRPEEVLAALAEEKPSVLNSTRERAGRSPRRPAPTWPRSPLTSRPSPPHRPRPGWRGRRPRHAAGRWPGRPPSRAAAWSSRSPSCCSPPTSSIRMASAIPIIPGVACVLSWPLASYSRHWASSRLGWPPRWSSGVPAGSCRPGRARAATPWKPDSPAAPAMARLCPQTAPTRPAPTCGLTAHGRAGRILPGGAPGSRAAYGRYRTPGNRSPSPFSLARPYVCRFGNLAPKCRHDPTWYPV